MIRIFTTALLCLSLPGQAVALSCMMWDAASVYQYAADAEERYVIGLGTFYRSGPDRITGDNGPDPDPYAYTAHFNGNLATRVGFSTPADFEVEVQISCAASWCGAALQDGQHVLAFMQVDDNRDYSLEIGPCMFLAVSEPSQEALDQVIQCVRGGACEPDF